MRGALTVGCVGVFACVLAAGSGWTAQSQVAGRRTIVVISDLHMGVGRRAPGQWHPYEDFRWSPEFAAFLDAVSADGAGAVDLVLNGDAFELLQSSDVPCGVAAGVGCSEPEARRRLDRVLAAHDADIKALGRFARIGSNRVVFVPGDHDAALLFEALGRRLVEAIASPSGRVDIAASGRWVSSDGRVVAEHGHQIGWSVDTLENWPAPFVRRDGTVYLARSAREDDIQSLYNRFEERYPIVDNLAAAGTGVKYALAAAGGADVAALAPRLARALLLITPWQQFRMELDDGEVESPVWDIAEVRRQGVAFMVASLPEDDPLKPSLVQVSASGALSPLMQQWTDDEIAAVCDYRAAMRRARRRFEPAVTQFAPRGPAVSECPRTPDTRGAQFDYFWGSRDRMFARYIVSIGRAAGGVGGRSIDVFVHGHTHLADRSQTTANMISGGLLKIPMEGFSPVRGALTPVAINAGAWQRTITPAQYELMRRERSMPDDQLLRSLQPEDLPPCYSFVRIPPYTDAPSPSVRYWRRRGGEWGFAASCGG